MRLILGSMSLLFYRFNPAEAKFGTPFYVNAILLVLSSLSDIQNGPYLHLNCTPEQIKKQKQSDILINFLQL